MSAKFSHRVFVVVLGAALCLLTSVTMAAIVTNAQIAASSQTEVEKTRIQAFMDRSDIKDSLQALGVSEPSAKDRVAAMTDQEVNAMVQKIDSMPAGGYLGNSDMVLILLIVLVLVLI
jgi:hypothetical protein